MQDRRKKSEKEQIWIIRWSDFVNFPRGKSYMASRRGTRQDAEEYARRIARENSVRVEAII